MTAGTGTTTGPGSAASPVRSYLLRGPEEGRLPTGTPHLFKAQADETGGRFDFMSAAFAPMTGPPLHLHTGQDDSFYVLEGVLTVQAGDDILDLGPGDFLCVPPGTPHTFENIHNGDRPVRALNVMTPGGFFPMFDEMGRQPEGPDREEAMARITEKYGTVILGPPLRVQLGLA